MRSSSAGLMIAIVCACEGPDPGEVPFPRDLGTDLALLPDADLKPDETMDALTADAGVKVPPTPILDIRLAWFATADLNLHLRKQGAAWGSADGDASWHNQFLPDWGEPRGTPGKICTQPAECFCDAGYAFGWCVPAKKDGDVWRCQEVGDDPLYHDDEISEGEEWIVIGRPAPGVYEVGADNSRDEPWPAQLIVSIKGEVVFAQWLAIPSSSEDGSVTLLGTINIPTGAEAGWEGASFTEAGP